MRRIGGSFSNEGKNCSGCVRMRRISGSRNICSGRSGKLIIINVYQVYKNTIVDPALISGV